MDYTKLNQNVIKSWRIGRLIGSAILAIAFIPIIVIFRVENVVDSVLLPVIGAVGIIAIYAIFSLIVFPAIEYRQWGYRIEEDKVVIKHGLFWIKKTIIPVIRIQNITIAQGPINRQLGLFKVNIALASGSFEIIGLDKETADSISENLKAKLYKRMEAKGDITDEVWS